MSFILNALKKSELERQSSQVEPLKNKFIGNQPILVKKSSSTWLIILALVNVLFLIFMFWSFTKDKKTIEPDASKTTVIKEIEEEKVLPSIAKLTKEYNQSSIAQQVGKKKAANKKTISKEPIQMATKRENSQLNQRETYSPIADIKPIETLEPIKPVNTVNSAEKQANDPPFLSDLPYDFRRSVPTIKINVFVYSHDEKERFIMVDMRKHQEGQQIEENMILKEIRRSSIVVDYKDRIFQISR